MSERLCPKCGAYWRCDCLLEELAPLKAEGCQHDWSEAVGVEVVDAVVGLEQAKVLVCRLCGLYAVEEKV
ncbi:MAG: hypothetical protein GEU75_11350 [Dehalococcoidia bacterium]|nr:hypothetical protein [Dehalococcoidia bacterium]